MLSRRDFLFSGLTALVGMFLPKQKSLPEDTSEFVPVSLGFGKGHLLGLDFLIINCSRCKKQITYGESETCWYCTRPLCYDCWDKYGHCGHPEAEKQNELARQGRLVNGTICDGNCNVCFEYSVSCYGLNGKNNTISDNANNIVIATKIVNACSGEIYYCSSESYGWGTELGCGDCPFLVEREVIDTPKTMHNYFEKFGKQMIPGNVYYTHNGENVVCIVLSEDNGQFAYTENFGQDWVLLDV